MTSYVEYNVTLTPGQKDKLLKAFKKHSPTTIRLANEQLKRPHDKIFITQRQVTHLEKAKREEKGAQAAIFTNTDARAARRVPWSSSSCPWESGSNGSSIVNQSCYTSCYWRTLRTG